MCDSDDQWKELIEGIRNGDELACQRFWDEYGPMIEKVAERNISSGVRRRVGSESIMLSACRTFFRRAQKGEFDLPDAESLLGLLCAITVNKVRMKVRYHRRKIRNVDAEEHPQRMPDVPQSEWTQEDEMEFEDQFQNLVAGFDEKERRVVELRLQEHTNDEIAQQLNCSERTVRRMMKRIQARLETMLERE